MNKFLSAAVMAALLPIAACTSDISPNHYNTSSVGAMGQAARCTVVSVRQVSVSSENNNAGSIIGGLAGGVAGSTIGGGNTAHILGALGGAVLGSVAGNAAQSGLSSQNGYEYVLQLDNGQLLTVTQGTNILLNPGQRCILLEGNPARVIPN